MTRHSMAIMASAAVLCLAVAAHQQASGRRPAEKTLSGQADIRPVELADGEPQGISSARSLLVPLASYTFDDGAGGADPQGWTSHDLTEHPIFFHVDDFNGLPGGDFYSLLGTKSLWCGSRGDNTGTWPGYGNNWLQWFESIAFGVSGDVAVDFLLRYDTEPGYDILRLETKSGDAEWVTRASWDGDNNFSGGERFNIVIPAGQHSGSLAVRFQFQSDIGWSDEDGLWASNGAAIIDDLSIVDATGTIDHQSFEAEAVGATATADGHWTAVAVPGVGNFAGLVQGTEVLQEDPETINTSHFWSFFNGSTTDYGCGGHPEQLAVPFPSIPGQYDPPDPDIQNEVRSPWIRLDIDAEGLWLAALPDSVLLMLRVYPDLPQNSLVFYGYRARYRADNGMVTDWFSNNIAYYGPQKSWIAPSFQFSRNSQFREVQVALQVVDRAAWGRPLGIGTGECHSHGPLLDDIEVLAVNARRGSVILTGPSSISVATGTATPPIEGRIWVEGLTGEPGPAPGLTVHLGYGPEGSDPSLDGSSWQWMDAVYHSDSDAYDCYRATLSITPLGTYAYCYRFCLDQDRFAYGDLDGSLNGYDPGRAGTLVVTEPQGVVPPVSDPYIPQGARTSFLSFGSTPHYNTRTASPFQAVTFYARSSGAVDGYGLVLHVDGPAMLMGYSIGNSGMNLCSAPAFNVGMPMANEVLITGQLMPTSTASVTVTLSGIEYPCNASQGPPIYSADSEIMPFFVSNAQLIINPGCVNVATISAGAASQAKLYSAQDASYQLEYVLEALAPVDVQPPRGLNLYIDLPSDCCTGVETGFFEPRSGSGPVIHARRGADPESGVAQFICYVVLDNSLAPGYYDFHLDLPGGGEQLVGPALRYAGFQGYQSAGTLTNAITGNVIRGAGVSLWRETASGGYEVYAAMTASDGTYGFDAPPGRYKIVVQYELGGYQERGPFTVNSPIPAEDIALQPVSDDTVAPTMTAGPPAGDSILGSFADDGVGLAVVEPIPASINNTEVLVEKFTPGAAEVQFQINRLDSSEPALVHMRGIDLLGNELVQAVSFDPLGPSTGIACVPTPQAITRANEDGAGSYRNDVALHYAGGGSAPVYGYSLDITWDPAVVSAAPADVTRPDSGPFASASLFVVQPIAGGVRVDAALGGAQTGIVSGDLCKIRFTAVAAGYAESAVTLLLNSARDSNNAAVTGITVEDGQIVVDTAAPAVVDVAIHNTTLAHTDDYLKDGDAIVVTAAVTDDSPGFGSDNIRADLSGLGGGGDAAPDSYVGGIATWNVSAAACTPADGTIQVDVVAIDSLGNTGQSSDTVIADNTAPAALSGLGASPGHQKVVLQWDNAYSVDPLDYRGVLIRYARRTDYPGYAVPEPDFPDAPGAGIGTAFDGTGDVAGAVHALPTPEDRDIYYYGGFVYDEAMNFSPAATAAGARATCYWLGDVCGASAGDRLYNGLVEVADVSAFGTAYGAASLPWPLNESDVGPTHDFSRLGIPMPDGMVDFEDLMIFAMNFGVVGPAKAPPSAAEPPVLSWNQIEPLVWSLMLDVANPALKGIHLSAELPAGVAAEVTPGGLIIGLGRPVFLKNIARNGLDVGLAVLGTGVGIEGAGELLRVALSAEGTPTNVKIKARSLENTDLGGAVDQPGGDVIVPAALGLAQNAPNPFNPSTKLTFTLPQPQQVRLEILGLNGARIRVLLDGPMPAGIHEVIWDGRNDGGQTVASGGYLCRMKAGSFTATRRMMLVK